MEFGRWPARCAILTVFAVAACSGTVTKEDDGNAGSGGSRAGGRGGSSGRGGGSSGSGGAMSNNPAPVAPAAGEEFACANAGAPDPGPTLVRRLTNREYAFAVQDALGVDLGALGAKLPADAVNEGFTNDAHAQTVALDHVETWAAIAADVARRVDRAKLVTDHASCRELTDTCYGGFLDKLAPKLMRRPIDDADRTALAPLLATIKGDGGTFDELAGLTVESILQSPRFLYRVEAERASSGTTRKLDDWEVAARLSFLLWSSGPDEELLAAAKSGSLSGDSGMTTQIDRMLASDRARRAGRGFLSDWLDLPRLGQLDSQLGADMRAETEAVFDEIVWKQNKPLTALYEADFTFASKALATHYGLSTPKDGLSQYPLASAPGGRRGILTHATVLSSGDKDASLVNRGRFVLRNVLCSSVPDPPVGVNNGRPDTEPGKPQRWYAEQRMTTSPCSNCHKHLDPLAFPLEAYTGLGAFRDKDERGNTIDTSGTLFTPYDEKGKAFKNTAEFISLVAADARVRDCMVLKPAQFAFGRALDQADRCTLKGVKDSLGDQGVTFQNVLKRLALQPSFRLLRVSN